MTCEASTTRTARAYKGWRNSAVCSHHPSIVCREMRTPCRLKIPSSRCKGRWSAPLLTITCAISPGPAKRAGNRLGRLAGHRHVLLRKRQAAFGQLLLAGVFLADMDDDEQRRGPPVELLAPLRRQLDQVLRAAQGRLLGLRQIVDDFLTLDLVGNPAAAVPVAVLGRPTARRAAVAAGWEPSLPRRPEDRTTRPAADRTSRSCCRRAASAAGACGALAAPDARWPSATLPTTARPTASAPPGRRAAGRDRAEARRPCSCPYRYPNAAK